MEYGLTSPCDNCPFRSDIQSYLRPERVREIQQSLVRSEFPCHKTMAYDGEDGAPQETAHTQHCAGALILLERLELPSQMMRICERLSLYDRRKLNMKAPVFDSFDEMVAAQKKKVHRRKVSC